MKHAQQAIEGSLLKLASKKAAKEGISVRALEQLTGETKAEPKKKKKRAEKSDIPSDHVHYISERLAQHFSTSVHVTPCKTLANGKKAKGSISIDFYSNEELDRLLEVLGLLDQL